MEKKKTETLRKKKSSAYFDHANRPDKTPETVTASKIETAPKLKNCSTVQKCVCYHPRQKKLMSSAVQCLEAELMIYNRI